MQRAVLILGLLVAAALFVGWATGGYAALQTQVLQGQQVGQAALAAGVALTELRGADGAGSERGSGCQGNGSHCVRREVLCGR